MTNEELLHNLQNNIPMQLHCFHTCSLEPVIVLKFGVGFPQDKHCPNCGFPITTENLTYEFVVKTDDYKM